MDWVEWVDTGAGIDRTYKALRAEAEAHARARNAAFDRAANAYRAGNKAEAARFGAQGQEEDAAMKKAQGGAANYIFSLRNPPAMRKRYAEHGVYMLDLHGLHKGEGIARVEAAMQAVAGGEACPSGAWVWLAIITGTGHHSRQDKSRLLPAVQEFLTTTGVVHQEASAPGSKEGGMLWVHVDDIPRVEGW
jgi:hypothetical protein